MKTTVKFLKRLIKEALEDVNELKLGLSTAPTAQQTKQASTSSQKPQKHKEEDESWDDDIEVDVSDFDQLKR